MGAGRSVFRPWRESLYWVEAEDGVFSVLDAAYRQTANLQYDEVFVDVEVKRLPAPDEGDASFYDGVLRVSELNTMDKLDAESCSKP